ncbi:protein-disulfide reductase DsbD [Moritella marina ATCC 15381]|uniref:Protein-disulfide reductase DsbD n=1 Tax=Moritella marina ATCC 15381 TaxID=1202962 RepID=A0A5J6WJ06_MORMI|nr:protein-disulfide reductase DsbD [Moritella marina]QFI38013.1 protein-disulfide reductase DsbD [Moritella marina ATCC 15381]
MKSFLNISKQISKVVAQCSIFLMLLMSVSVPALAQTSSNAPTEFLTVHEAFPFTSHISRSTDGEKLVLNFATQAGYYLYHKRFSFTAIADDLDGSISLAEPQFSVVAEQKQDPNFGSVKVYHQALTVTLPFTGSGNVKVSYQGCADSGLCYLPQRKTINVSAVETSSIPTQNSALVAAVNDTANDSQGLASMLAGTGGSQALFLFFVLGLGLAFTPCVLPMIPILSSIIGGQGDGMTGWKGFYISLAYVLGMASSYAMIGVLMATVGQGINIQAAMQQTWLLVIFAGLFVLLALAMFGVYELQLPSRLQVALNNQSQRLSGGKVFTVFMMGAISALVVSPCVSAPLAGALLYVSTTQDWLFGGGVLFVMALGMGVPLVIIGTSGGKLLPRSGPWMIRVKQGFGVMLLAIAILLISRFAAPSVALGLWALLIISCAMYIHNMTDIQVSRLWLRHVVVFVSLVYGAMLMIGVVTGADDLADPLQHITQRDVMNKGAGQGSQPLFMKTASVTQIETAINNLPTPKTVTMVDLYADWCTSCKVMDKQVFSHADVVAKMTDINAMKFDITDNTTAQSEWMAQTQLFGPPSMLFFDTNGQELQQLRVVGEMDKQQFLAHLELVAAAVPVS